MPSEDEQIRAVFSQVARSVLLNAVERIDRSPAMTWTGPGGVRERLIELIETEYREELEP